MLFDHSTRHSKRQCPKSPRDFDSVAMQRSTSKSMNKVNLITTPGKRTLSLRTRLLAAAISCLCAVQGFAASTAVPGLPVKVRSEGCRRGHAHDGAWEDEADGILGRHRSGDVDRLDGNLPAGQDFVVTNHSWPATAFKVADSRAKLTISTSSLKVAVDKGKRARWRFLTRPGRPLLAEFATGGKAIPAGTVNGERHISPSRPS